MSRIVFLAALLPLLALSQRPGYREGDWITFSDFRFVSGVAVGTRYVYVGTTNGVERFDHVWETWESPLTVSDGLPSPEVTALLADRERGLTWIATSAGVVRYLEAIGEWDPVSGVGDSPLSINRLFLAQGPFGQAVFGRSEEGWFRYDYRFGRWVAISPEALPSPRARTGSRPLDERLLQDPRFTFLHPGYVSGEGLRSFPYTVLEEGDGGRVYVGTWGDNLHIYSRISDSWEQWRYGLGEAQVGALARDFVEGAYWFCGLPVGESGLGSGGRGLTRASGELDRWAYFEPSLIRSLHTAGCWAISVGERWVWFGTAAGLSGYARDDREWRTWDERDGLPDLRVLTVYPNRERLWVGTARGLAVLDLEELSVSPMDGPWGRRRITSLVGDGERIWVGTEVGLYREAQAPGTWEPVGVGREGLAGAGIVDLAWHDGRLYVATNRGLEIVDQTTGDWTRFLIGASFIDQPILALAVDRDNVWLAHRDGVTRWDRRLELWTFYTEEEGLAATPVYDILVDGDYVWFATGRGATRFYWNSPHRVR